MAQKLIISKGIDMEPHKQEVLAKFCVYCMDCLGMDTDVHTTIYIESDRGENGIKTTAFYNPANDDVKVYGKNRALADICRSVAHELVHMSQRVRGLLGRPTKDIGGFHEDEANAVAGQIIKMFARDVSRDIYESRSRTGRVI
jgi:hypothetical protein